MRTIVLIAHNLRSTHNVGSLLRTAEGLGIDHVYLTGYTPYPLHSGDERLPHLAAKIDRQIAKTALGAQEQIRWSFEPDIATVLDALHADRFILAALEQSPQSATLPDYVPPGRLAVLVGREVEGVEQELLQLCDLTLEIPMFGHKESFNVVQAAAMALYHCRFAD